jgi:hypothetical protein
LYNGGFIKITCALAAAPTNTWLDINTTELEVIARNSLHLDASSNVKTNIEKKIPNYMSALVARLKTILGRDLRQHDTKEELLERTTVTQPHYYHSYNDPQCDCWLNELFITLCKYAQEALTTAPDTPQSATSWWHNRAMWLSSGTSSNKKPNTLLTQQIATTRKHVRITKKLACSYMPENWINDAIKTSPKMECRAATKNEPGLKLRPLRASDDKSYLIAAMASNNLEKYLSIHGSVMRQTPDDVRRTSQAITRTRNLTKKHILCIDYSNFNNTHTTRSRVVVNLAMALAFKKNGASAHAKAALWLAFAQLQHTIDGKLSNQGLSSGERDTARDNTMLHNAYSKMAMRSVNTTNDGSPAMMQMCGDDEIAIGATWSWCVNYTIAHGTQGHALQTRKLMLSSQQGEFLQYNMFSAKKLPTQPLPPALNNFVSGSWYKTAAYNSSEYPQQVAAAAASCIRRGAPHDVMLAMAISTCSWLCNELPWKTMLQATPLFGALTTTPRVLKSDKTSAVSWLRTTSPQAATDYCAALKKRLRLDDEQMNIVVRHVANNIFSTLLADIRNTEYQVQQPQDIERVINTCTPNMDIERLSTHWLNAVAATRHDELTWLAVQIGVPPELIKNIGLKTIVEKSTNTMRAHINIPEKKISMKVQPVEYAMLPGAIAPYFTATN